MAATPSCERARCIGSLLCVAKPDYQYLLMPHLNTGEPVTRPRRQTRNSIGIGRRGEEFVDDDCAFMHMQHNMERRDRFRAAPTHLSRRCGSRRRPARSGWPRSSATGSRCPCSSERPRRAGAAPLERGGDLGCRRRRGRVVRRPQDEQERVEARCARRWRRPAAPRGTRGSGCSARWAEVKGLRRLAPLRRRRDGARVKPFRR